ncbi:MAG TPA: DUF1992 domain-containing protein [Thioalkalivibrio sp.]|nr:DUF1992 domain-containing protein [Thioalkalivibrio sp.]
MSLLDDIVEQRLAEAAARGEFDDLPGAGRPLPIEPDDPFVAPELRMAYKILKNAGFVPEEVRLRREIRDVEVLIREASAPEERNDAARRLRVLMSRLDAGRGGPLALQQAYYEQMVERLSREG